MASSLSPTFATLPHSACGQSCRPIRIHLDMKLQILTFTIPQTCRCLPKGRRPRKCFASCVWCRCLIQHLNCAAVCMHASSIPTINVECGFGHMFYFPHFLEGRTCEAFIKGFEEREGVIMMLFHHNEDRDSGCRSRSASAQILPLLTSPFSLMYPVGRESYQGRGGWWCYLHIWQCWGLVLISTSKPEL